ncbi:MAG: hypothetical protein MUF56_00775 [Solirubrobacteraceae bacterium]|jgi:hypothetical protein|nr:hypothetical protein [Solirubrobacteraceae bacterium]
MMRLLLPAGCAITLLAAASPATAAQLTSDRSCYVTNQQMVLSGSGFTPGADVDLTARGTTPLRGPADAAGAFGARLTAPTGASLGLKSTERTTIAVTATDAAGVSAQASVTLVQFAFKTDGGQKSPRALRTWKFSGFQDTTRPIYGHFRFAGKTIANYRFGKPSGACGLLTKRAPGIPARSRGGLWTIQIDQNRTYKPGEKVALKVQSFVRTVLR